jgi:acetyl-CoA carboxylase carboxyl transferase subunit alpha
MAVVLDFEKPIAELEKKLQDLREFSDKQGVDVGQSIEILEEKIAAERKNVYSKMTPWQRVQLARHPERPYARDYIARLFTDFLELHGDRRYADDGAMIGGFAKFKDHPVMVIGTQKGRNLEENVAVNFGSAHPEGYRKALRFMEMADKARVPIVVLVDTPGAYPGIAAEERHIAEAIAVNLREMFTFTVPIVVAVIGEGGSGGALGIGIGNRVLVMENAYYSVITPEGCAAILWRDGAAAPKAAEALKLTGPDLMKFGLIDEIVKEPLGGANRDWDAAAELLAEAIDRNLCELRKLTPNELRADRYDKFRLMGVFEEGK